MMRTKIAAILISLTPFFVNAGEIKLSDFMEPVEPLIDECLENSQCISKLQLVMKQEESVISEIYAMIEQPGTPSYGDSMKVDLELKKMEDLIKSLKFEEWTEFNLLNHYKYSLLTYSNLFKQIAKKNK